MKTVENFLKTNPSYVKCSADRIANRLHLSVNIVNRFRRTDTYKNIRIAYLNEN